MNCKVIVDLNPSLEKNLDQFQDEVIYEVARETLDRTIPVIPYFKGELMNSTLAYGVKGSNKDYTIGSQTAYASRVWKFNDATTNWTTTGTHSKWFEYIWKKDHDNIVSNVIERNKLK